MDTFTTILVTCCVIYLIHYYWRQYKKYKEVKKSLTWPREYTRCPDYWTHEGDHICRNIYNLGKCPEGADGLRLQATVDMKSIGGGIKGTGTALDKAMAGPETMLKKCRWARKCESSWEGVDKLCT